MQSTDWISQFRYRWFKYLGNILHGDFGTSIKMQKNRAVLSIIMEMFPVSAKIGSIALLWAVLVGVPLGCLAAFKRGTWGRQSPAYCVYIGYFHAWFRSCYEFCFILYVEEFLE